MGKLIPTARRGAIAFSHAIEFAVALFACVMLSKSEDSCYVQSGLESQTAYQTHAQEIR